MPRSGNTLLSCILNQNPKIKSTAHSFTPDLFFKLNEVERYCHTYNNFPDPHSMSDVYKSIFPSFYKRWNADYIIERGDWCTPYNFKNLQKYSPNEIKIVVLVRDVLDVIKSYLKLCQHNPDFFINKTYNDLDKTTLYQTEQEIKSDIIMARGGYIDASLYSIQNIITNDLFQYCKFIEYDDLVNNTEDTINSIYDFYGIEKYYHDFNKLDQFSINGLQYNDLYLGAPMHTIKCDGVSKQLNNIILNDKTISKYSGLEQWRSFNV